VATTHLVREGIVSGEKEPIKDQLVGSHVVEPFYPGSSPRLDTGVHILLDLF
jgi:hypothetical protein